MCTLAEMLTLVPVVDISHVVNNGFPAFHTVGCIALQDFCTPPEVSMMECIQGFNAAHGFD